MLIGLLIHNNSMLVSGANLWGNLSLQWPEPALCGVSCSSTTGSSNWPCCAVAVCHSSTLCLSVHALISRCFSRVEFCQLDQLVIPCLKLTLIYSCLKLAGTRQNWLELPNSLFLMMMRRHSIARFLDWFLLIVVKVDLTTYGQS